MAEITAAAVKALRDKTQLPMMDCKKALTESGGDEEAAMLWLREHGLKFMGSRNDRSTEEGRLAIYTSPTVGAIVELQCESAPVASQEEFVQLANDLAQQLATGPGAETPEDLLKQDSPSKPGTTLQEQMDELANRIREVFRVSRAERVDGPTGGYVHHDAKTAVLLHAEGGDADTAKDISMHITAADPRPQVVNREEVDEAEVTKERDFLVEQAKKEGKPDNIIEKMVDGRMRNFYAERVLVEQPFVKDDKQTVGKVAEAAGMKIKGFKRWQLGQ